MSFKPAELSCDGFVGGRLNIYQPLSGYRAATDPVFLAAFTQAGPGARVLDLGCGVGTAGLCLARRVGNIELHGLEIQPEYAELAVRNAAENSIPMTVHTGDVLAPPSALRQMSFDFVMINPPFYPGSEASGSPVAGRDVAHREGNVDLAVWISSGLRRLVQKGQIAIIHRTERLPEILAGLSGRAGQIQILPLSARQGRPAARVLVRARKSSATPLTLFSPLTVHKGGAHVRDEKNYTETVSQVLSGLSGLLP